MIRSILLLMAVGLSGAMAGQPDRTEALEKAKNKFEKDIGKSEETLLAGIDKTLAKALTASNKALHEKLTYEREMFVKLHFVPTAFAPETYLKQRTQAITALQAVYQPVITELTKAKKISEAAAIEAELSELVKKSRGYGIAFPDLETKAAFLIENKSSGLVIERVNNPNNQFRYPELQLKEKVGKKNQAQCWRIEREEKGIVFRNVGSGEVFTVPYGLTDTGMVINTFESDRTKEISANALFIVNEVQREIAIERPGGLILTVTEKKLKGVTTTYVTQEKKDATPTTAQLWTITEAK